jgi:hypothetical protein
MAVAMHSGSDGGSGSGSSMAVSGVTAGATSAATSATTSAATSAATAAMVLTSAGLGAEAEISTNVVMQLQIIPLHLLFFRLLLFVDCFGNPCAIMRTVPAESRP